MLSTWRWLFDRRGGIGDLKSFPLVTPTRDFFPSTEAVGHARAEHIFSQVKRHAGMSDWACDLVPQPRRADLRVGELAALKPIGPQTPAGTFSIDGNRAVVTYDPAGLDDPMALVATFVHELAHYWLLLLGDPPGGAEVHELATDLATVYLGFGLFGANSAFNFSQQQGVLSQGWSWSRQGYLDQRAWCFALAVFFALREQSVEAAHPFLKPHLSADLRKACRYLRRTPNLLARVSAG